MVLQRLECKNKWFRQAANTHKMHLRRQAQAHVSQGSVHIFGEENIYLDTRVDLLRSLHIWWRVQTWARQGVHTRSIWGKAERERDREADGDCSTISISQKRLFQLSAQKFFFQRELQRGNIRHPLFLFFSLLTSIEDKWGCGPDSVDKLVISGWSERHSSLEFFPSDLHFFFLPTALICISSFSLMHWSAFLFFNYCDLHVFSYLIFLYSGQGYSVTWQQPLSVSH